jgi:ATP-dependent DNA helicase RecG
LSYHLHVIPGEVRTLLRRLDGEPADALESETLECLSWDLNPSAHKPCVRALREAVVCLANARGGVILVGIGDRKRTRAEAIHGVGDVDVQQLRRDIYAGTEPSILVDVEEVREPEGRVLLVRVPRGLPPHTTTDGVGKIRVNKECLPLTASRLTRLMMAGGTTDLTAEVLTGATIADLDPAQLRLLKRSIEAEAGNASLAAQPDEHLVRNLGLVREDGVTLAACLLLGRPGALARWAPQHEVVFLRYKTQTRYDVRHDLKGPLLAVLERVQQLLSAHLKLDTIGGGGFAEVAAPDLTWWAAREAVLNALVHRDYFVRQSVMVELHPHHVRVVSPGGFIGGVTPTNILRHPPVRRNSLLASALQQAGLVNRAGLGVDRIWEELLRLGKEPPRYAADESSVSLTLPTRTHAPFARFVAEEVREGRRPELDDLILLRALTKRGSLDRWSAAEHLHLPEEDAAERLAGLRERGYLVARGRGRGTSYCLTRDLSDRLRGAEATVLEMDLDDEAVRLRLQAVLAERGRLTNADVRRLGGQSRAAAVRLMRELQNAGLAVLEGRGRGAHYVPGPKLARPRGGPASPKPARGAGRSAARRNGP